MEKGKQMNNHNGNEVGDFRHGLLSDIRRMLEDILQRHHVELRQYIDMRQPNDVPAPEPYETLGRSTLIVTERPALLDTVDLWSDNGEHGIHPVKEVVECAVALNLFDRVKLGTFDVAASTGNDFAELNYNVMNFYKQRGCAQAVARSDIFGNLTLFVITLNAAYLGIDTEFNKEDDILDYEWPFITCENLFCVYFTGEILFRFCAFVNKRNCFKDNWFRFDGCLVSMMVLETWLIPGMQLVSGSGGLPLPTGVFRLLRLLRLSRLARLMRSIPELITMVKGMRYAARAVGSSLLMVFMLIYVFAIVLHMFISDETGDKLEMKFSSLPLCMWTLLMDGTFMDSTGSTLWPLLTRGRFNTVLSVVVFLAFTLLSAMTVMNMLIGILCEVVSAVAAADRDEIALTLLKDSILMALMAHDDDKSGTISPVELSNTLQDPHAVGVLNNLSVDIEYLLEFQAMNVTKGEAEMKIESVIEFILKFRGDQPSCVKHLIEVNAQNRFYLKKGLTKMYNRLETRLQDLQECANTAIRKVDAVGSCVQFSQAPHSDGNAIAQLRQPDSGPVDAPPKVEKAEKRALFWTEL